MRHKVMWATVGMLALWMAVVGGTILLDFDRVQQSNQATAELEWTFICDEMLGKYAAIEPVQGGENFIGRSYKDVESTLIDEKGRALSGTYEELESIGNGYVRYERAPYGEVSMSDSENKGTDIGVLNDQGQELPEEEALKLLHEDDEKSAQTQMKQNNADTGYRVVKGDRKYVGIKDGAGNWFIPPAFDHIEITEDQKYAVIKNGSNIGIAVLEK